MRPPRRRSHGHGYSGGAQRRVARSPAAGCDVVQIDEPAMTRYHEKVFEYGARALDRCLEGIQIPSIVHLCYGYPGGAGQQHEYEYPELLEELMKTKIEGGASGALRGAITIPPY